MGKAEGEPMDRKAPSQRVKRDASAELSPAEALMLRLENIEPAALERLGAEEELRLETAARRRLASRMEAASATEKGVAQPQCVLADLPPPSWIMPAADDGLSRQSPGDWARIYGDSMADFGLRHGDRARVDHEALPSHGDIVLAEVEGVGRVLRKLEIIGGVHVLTGSPGVKPIAIADLSQITYHGVVALPLSF
jgi:hypothetical protein